MLYQEIDKQIAERESWALRRQRGIPNSRRLWVLACMDERVPVEQALGLQPGDAHVFRNAGGVVTDDAIRSALITTRLLGTREIIVLGHTECGMMMAEGEQIVTRLRQQGVDPDSTFIDPSLPELRLEQGAFARWLRNFTDADESCLQQVELLRNCPLIPDDVVINGYVLEVESMKLRRPNQRLADRVNTSEQMARATTYHTMRPEYSGDNPKE
jgi:carbonic anhydrase